MRIVHVLPSLIMGGAERAVIDLANWQAAQGRSVTLAVGWKDPKELLRSSVDDAVRVEYIGRSAYGRYPQALWWVWRRRRWLADQHVVHVHLSYGAVIGTALYVLRAIGISPGPAIIETYHAVAMPLPHAQQRLHMQLMKARDSIVLMAEDPHWRNFRQSRPYPRTALIPNGLAPPKCFSKSHPKVREYRSALGVPDGSVALGHLGRLVAERRPELMLQVFARVSQRLDQPAHFLFVGEGPEEARLKALARELGIDRMHFPGLARDASAALGAMDVFLTINAGTVTGLAGVHAAFCGVPIVAVQLDPEYQPTGGDWIRSSSDVDAVAADAARLLADESARTALGRKQRDYACRNLTVSRAGEAYNALYDQLIRSEELSSTET